MLTAAIFLMILYLIFLLWEKWNNERALASFQYVIHVNGIRGKTSVCRLIDAALRGAGYRVFTKTTGSTPFYIDTDGEEHQIFRKGPANIGEQLSMIRLAHRQKAQVVILECMAVNPTLQKIAQEQIVKGNLNVITNVRYDHIFEMGKSLDEIAESLSGTIPENGVLLTADPSYFPYFSKLCQEKNCIPILCSPCETAPDENTAIAWELSKRLGIDETSFLESLKNYKEDFGARKCYHINEQIYFLNLFSANDPQSSVMALQPYLKENQKVIFVYNNRTDRPDRLLLFIRHFFKLISHDQILVIGENRSFAVRLLKKHGLCQTSALSDPQRLLTPLDTSTSVLYVGIGNIKGAAYSLLQILEERESEYHE